MKGYFNSIEDLYNQRFHHLVKVAERHIYSKDQAIDVVHNAIAKAIEYFNRHPEKKVQLQIVEWLVLKSCKKFNKYSPEIACGHPTMIEGSDKEWTEPVTTELDFNGKL